MASKDLNSTEALILQLEAQGPALGGLPETQLFNVTIDILSEVKIITGALLYPDKSFEQKAQVLMLTRLISRTPKYHRLTRDEFTQAFYMNAAGFFPDVHRHYNRELNAEFVGDVLNAYLRWKDLFIASKIGKINRALNGETAPPVPVRTYQDIKADIIRDMQLFRNGHGSLIFNINEKYVFLRRMGYIIIRDRAHWWNWFRFAADIKRSQVINTPAETLGAKVDKKQLITVLEGLIERGELPRESYRSMAGNMRRAVYLEHIRVFVETAIRDPFAEVKPYVIRRKK